MTGNVDLNSLLAVLDDVVSVHDLDGRLIHISSSCAHLIGFEPSELEGRTGSDLVHPEDRARLLGLVRDLVAGLAVPETEWRCLTRAGGHVWLSTSARLVPAEAGRPGRIVARSIPISARKEAEDRVRQVEKLEAISRLAGGIAHEFNNLLTIISGYGEFLLEAHPTGTPAHQPLSEIHRAAERAAHLTRQLLAISRRQMMAPVVLDINQLLYRLEADLRSVLGNAISLHLEPGPDLWQLKMDPVQLEQALLQLARHARSAMPGGGALTIQTANEERISATPSPSQELPAGRYVRLTVCDTGPGMDATTLAHVFEPYYTTRLTGTGLGLPVVYGIVKQLCGHIQVESAPGAGTCFIIHFPALADASPSPATPAPKTVLLVEDEPAVRQLAAQVLCSAGYEVLEAGSGTEALRVYEQHPGPIHLLLTDLLMPDLGGSDLARDLLKRSSRLQVVFMSGYTTERSLIGQPLHGRQPSFLAKPFRPADLLRVVHDALAGAG